MPNALSAAKVCKSVNNNNKIYKGYALPSCRHIRRKLKRFYQDEAMVA